MARHRSPRGRRQHHGSPLPALAAAAGPSGARRADALPLVSTLTPARGIALVVAGGFVAAAGQSALSQALPAAAEGANVLRMGVEEVLGANVAPVAAQTVTAPVDAAPALSPALSPVLADPVVTDATELVKAADLHRQVAEAEAAARAAAEAARAAEEAARAAEAARVAEAARAAEAERIAAASVAGGVQMVVGQVTSAFGPRWGTQHMGIDIAAPIGTPIRVPLGGTVIDSGPASGFGLWVRVQHDDGTVTVYGHINRAFVSVGETVSAGDVIAEVGNRGESTGPHLHFEVVDPSGTKINPRPWLDQRGIGYT